MREFLVQIVPLALDETYTCAYCGFAEFELEAESAFVLADRPGFYFCSADCAEDYATDSPSEESA